MRRCVIAALMSLFLLEWAGSARADDLGRAGTFLAIEGTVLMQPATLTPPRKVQPYDEVGPLAIVETKPGSRVKVLFDDDTLVTLGEKSRMEMTEQTYQAGAESRVFVAHLTRGKARVLVGRRFKGDNSTFEVHSKTAVVSARGTYFVTWIEEAPKRPPVPDRKGGGRPPVDEPPADYEGATGVANIGTSGDITFTSGGATVLVLPGQSSVAMPGFPPSDPVSMDAPGIGGGPVTAALAGTALADVPRAESPRAALASVGIGGGTGSLPSTAGSAMAAPPGGQFASGAYAVPGWPLPVTPVTPPAVVSGAAGTTLNFTIRLP
jgi:hypothetical protein